MGYTVTLLPGDGIGPEIAEAMTRVVAAAGVEIHWERYAAGTRALEETGEVLPEAVLESLRRNRVGIKGPLTTPIGRGFQSVNVTLRKTLDLYVGLRPVKVIPELRPQFAGVDIVVVRENTEGLYAGVEHVVVPGVVASLKVITDRASRRIARFAFEYARRHGRRKVTAVHKANIMKLTDGLFLECVRDVASAYRDIAYEEMIIDACAMHLVLDPTRFDVLVMENFYGDVLSDLCAGLAGGLGVVPGANLGDEVALFEAVHGSAPDIAGQDRANPSALILSAALMLRHLGEEAAAARIEEAVRRVIAARRVVTPDLGGRAGTRAMTDAIIAELAALPGPGRS
ncbi:MAG TPA: isocitrate/isopropylmalate dehydrogenase family protein [Thermodesulfobacteriota bacterium]|nr:isocitrate/isopropylmalate dehydrogenase family protein [Thermodesulfobacteriota bacterium]